MIVRFDDGNDTGDVVVIIKFADKEKATDFINNADAYKEGDDCIKIVRPVSGYDESISSLIRPKLISTLSSILTFLVLVF